MYSSVCIDFLFAEPWLERKGQAHRARRLKGPQGWIRQFPNTQWFVVFQCQSRFLELTFELLDSLMLSLVPREGKNEICKQGGRF